MPAAFPALVLPDGLSALHCPATGRPVFTRDLGFDPDSAQSPNLRFVIDLAGCVWVVDPSHLPADQADSQRRLVKILESSEDDFQDQNSLVAACVDVMPTSALVLEILDPAQGSFTGEIAYFGFDLSSGDCGPSAGSVILVPATDVEVT